MKIRAVKIDPVFYKKTGWIKEIEYEELELDDHLLYDQLKKMTRFGAYVIGYDVGRMWSLSQEGTPFVFINGFIFHPLYKEHEQNWLWLKITKKILNMAGFYNEIGRFSADSVAKKSPLLTIVKSG